MYRKSFLIVFTAIVLICALPISSSAMSISDSDMLTYRPVDKVSGDSLGEFPAVGVWYHFTGADYESVGIYDSGNPTYAFLIWIPTQGYYLVSVQSMDMRYQLRGHVQSSGQDYYLYGTLYIQKNSDGLYQNTYYQWRGNGGYALEYDSARHFQTAFLSYYLVFHRIYTKTVNGNPQRSSYEAYTVPNYKTPDQPVQDKIQEIVNQNLGGGNVSYVPNGSNSTIPTNPDGTPVETDKYGNPIPTYPGGRPAETFPDGTPVPTGTDGKPLQYIILPDGSIYVIPEGYEPVTNPNTGEPVTDQNGEPVTQPVSPITIQDDAQQSQRVSQEFSKLWSIVSDVDDISSLMESNKDVLSSHIDDTRSLVDGVLSWFPAPVIACIVCGAIMIIAVKISGSGNSA